jgi:hypothetical protein
MNFDLVQKLSFLEIWLVTAYISPPWEQLKSIWGRVAFMWPISLISFTDSKGLADAKFITGSRL